MGGGQKSPLAWNRVKMKQKNRKGLFFDVLLSTLCASLLGNLLTGKDAVRACVDTIRANQNF